MSNKDRLDWFLKGLTISEMMIVAIPDGFLIHLNVNSKPKEIDDEWRI